MGRVVRDWKPEKVEDAVMAPHRYTWDSEGSQWDAPDYKTWLASVPYKAGENVYLDFGGRLVKAHILNVVRSDDGFGFRREAYTVQVETKTGHWSKLWERTHPGFIQRGYLLAGLAPDCEGKL